MFILYLGIQKHNNDNSDTVESDERDQQSTIGGNSTNVDFQTINYKDGCSEDEAETPAGVTDTMS